MDDGSVSIESSEEFARSQELIPELDGLLSNWDHLTQAERDFALKYSKYVDRGYRVTKYMMRACQTPYPKQQIFLSLNDLEAYTGGSTGGGKSSALLLAALQYVDIPTYSACIFRATFKNLSKAGAIMSRAKDWLIYDGSDVHWNANDFCFTFPSGAKLAFAYMQSQKDADNHRSAEYTFLGYDEVTEIPEECYRFLFSRLRRNKTQRVSIPLRCRAASNPGGEFSEWVKKRFIPQEYLDCRDNDYRFERVWKKGEWCADCEGTGILKNAQCFYCDGAKFISRTFIPSRIQDNPAMDANEYRKALSKLTFVERMQAEHGDWNITAEGGVFRAAWFRNYEVNGDYIRLIRFDEHNRPLPVLTVHKYHDCTIFVTADTATKEKTTADYSCICTWAFHRKSGSLMLLDVFRKQVDTPDLLPLISNAMLSSRAAFVLIEEASSGVELIQALRKNNACIGGKPVSAYLPHSKDKVARSVHAQIRMENGMIYFPAFEAPWKAECQAELLSFPKAPHDDFVDNVTMAAWYAENHQLVFIGGGGNDAPLEVRVAPSLPGSRMDLNSY